MATKKKDASPSSATDAPTGDGKLRLHAEQQFAAELAALAEVDERQRPPNWKLSPWAVKTYLLGGKLASGLEVSPKYVGHERLIEIAVATLATDRALLLYGVPGTAKSWVSEHLSAAICGTSGLLIQGTAGTDEAALRYGWNYARLLAEGPSRDALVSSPVMNAMETGRIVRIEELTRIPSEVQDALITILSEKTLPIPELSTEVQAAKGFNVIATANNRDKGVNELSSASCGGSTPSCCRSRKLSKTNWRSSPAVPSNWGEPSSCPPKSRRWKRFAASSRSSANCETA
ncbi:MAG: AAA family ATPase [Pirellulales bacterium]